MIRDKMLRLLLYDYQRTARYYTIYRTFKQWSSDDFTTILRLFVGRNYDYSRSCYDYSSRNATTIAYLYWLSGESPKRDAAQAASGSAPPRPCRRVYTVQVETLTPAGAPGAALASDPQTVGADPAGLVWSAVCCTVRHGSITWGEPLPLYIPYYNRAVVLSCIASGVVLVSGIRWRRYGAVIRSSVAQAAL